MPVIFPGFVTFGALVAGPSHGRVGLAGRSANQDYIAPMTLRDLCKPRIDFHGRHLRTKFELYRFKARTLPFVRKERPPIRFRNFAIEKSIIVSRRGVIELAKKTSKPKRLER